MTDENTNANHQPQQLVSSKTARFEATLPDGRIVDAQPVEVELLAKVLPAGGPLLGQPAPECRRCPGCTNQGACHSDEGGAA